MDAKFEDIDDPRSTVSLQLAKIQQRCTELLEEPDALGLCLEEPIPEPDSTNPYDCGP
jgi:hypothetical protein